GVAGGAGAAGGLALGDEEAAGLDVLLGGVGGGAQEVAEADAPGVAAVAGRAAGEAGGAVLEPLDVQRAAAEVLDVLLDAEVVLLGAEDVAADDAGDGGAGAVLDGRLELAGGGLGPGALGGGG